MYDILLAWRRLMDQRDEIDGRGRILMTSLNLAQDLVEKDSLFAQPVVALFDLLDVHVPLEGVPGNVTQIFASHFDQVAQKTVISAATGAIGGRNRNDVNSTSSGSKTEDERRYTGVAEILEVR
ncbi:hypothetical protein HPB48_000794 [Haemaphysalis longicornis]|uniref:Uncharacterized protein n=1 Tax=Haemaphysalis longicornis TaxID=44386 RepID=A0A9J6GKP0_HAELO|nr:hypothetical protein HPB48_000794 [Haemaphysalis longicornis]